MGYSDHLLYPKFTSDKLLNDNFRNEANFKKWFVSMPIINLYMAFTTMKQFFIRSDHALKLCKRVIRCCILSISLYVNVRRFIQ